eukprot:CAMPEP_0119353592 /NCGR_PEP_ID=MMETSP1334-20130426/2709_1 /TAXON_ID=127549 /ORGANISM="Calcidiscus leptoporus, Strain RCC1130" /LENGTH=157 /DNA_ID=CAMNT_0007366905 /DNA_START=311 /DNA_END=784 /DNA_ORIENTATION=-
MSVFQLGRGERLSVCAEPRRVHGGAAPRSQRPAEETDASHQQGCAVFRRIRYQLHEPGSGDGGEAGGGLAWFEFAPLAAGSPVIRTGEPAGTLAVHEVEGSPLVVVSFCPIGLRVLQFGAPGDVRAFCDAFYASHDAEYNPFVPILQDLSQITTMRI